MPGRNSASHHPSMGLSIMKNAKSCLVWTAVLLTAVCARAQDQVEWSAHGPAKALNRSERFSVAVTAVIAAGWHIYSFTQPAGGPITSQATVPANQPFSAAGAISGPPPHRAYDPNFEMETETYQGSIDFNMPIVVQPDAPPGTQNVAIDFRFQTCSETTCMPPKTVHLSAPVKITAVAKTAVVDAPKPAETVAPLFKPLVSTAPSSSVLPALSTATTAGRKTNASSGPNTQSLWSFIWLAAAMGGLSLLTPCVFPMIPITVSYFTSRASTNRRGAVFTAAVFALGIILTFSALGMLLALVFGAGGVNRLAANPWVNLLITLIFVGFALSLFGAYFIQLPSGLLNKVNSLTSSNDGSHVLGAVLMGFTFTLTSFTCTAPFVGTLLVMTAEGNWRWPLAGMLAFSTVFAIPFFVLALVPQWVTGLPKAGQWMVSVKVVMGLLEIAAAMKFLSNADIIWHWGIFTRQAVLSVWIGIGLLIVLYVLGCFRLIHESPIGSVGAGRLTIAIVFLAVTVWMVPGLFGRPLGELESFLPPDPNPGSYAATSSSVAVELRDPQWILNDYPAALALAKQRRRPIFIDFTGYTCTNCRWMEANIFPRPEIRSELKKFVLVRLYTDGDGPKYQQQQSMENARFGTVALPLYALLTPDEKLIATFSGLTRKSDEYLHFLRLAE